MAITLKAEISRGKEGIIYTTDDASLVAKEYINQPDETALEKIQIMSDLPRFEALRSSDWIAFPRSIWINKAEGTTGFLMKSFSDHCELKKYKEIRNLPVKHLLFIISGLFAQLSFLHENDFIFGDLQPSNLLLPNDTHKPPHDFKKLASAVKFIDCDTYQFQTPDSKFYCKVGIPDFMSPRILNLAEQNKGDLNNVWRLPEDDCYAGLVIAFQLLLSGYHPMMKVGSNIRQGIISKDFPWGNNRSELPKGANRKKYDKLPLQIRTLFSDAFNGKTLPSASEISTIFALSAKSIKAPIRSSGPNKLKPTATGRKQCSKCKISRPSDWLNSQNVCIDCRKKKPAPAPSTKISSQPSQKKLSIDPIWIWIGIGAILLFWWGSKNETKNIAPKTQRVSSDTNRPVIITPKRTNKPRDINSTPPVLSNKRLAQQELKRLGLYRDKIDGQWGENSRSALREFLRRTGRTGNGWPYPTMLSDLKASTREDLKTPTRSRAVTRPSNPVYVPPRSNVSPPVYVLPKPQETHVVTPRTNSTENVGVESDKKISDEVLWNLFPETQEETIVKAQPISRLPPKMPSRAEKSGHCKMRFNINTIGRTENVLALSCTQRLFQNAAVDAVKKWRYKPELINGKAVTSSNIEMTVTFKLVDENGRLIPE